MSEITMVAQQRARIAQLEAFVRELVSYQAEQFDGDPASGVDLRVSGADTVDWLGQFREVAKGVLEEAPTSLIVVSVGDPFSGIYLRGPFADHDAAEAWADQETDGNDWPYNVVEVDLPNVAEADKDPAPASGSRAAAVAELLAVSREAIDYHAETHADGGAAWFAQWRQRLQAAHDRVAPLPPTGSHSGA